MPFNKPQQSPEIMTSIVLQELASAIDKSLSDLVGQKMGFSLVVFQTTDSSRTSYVSNCDRKEVRDALAALIKHWDEGMPDIPAHKVQ